MVEALVLTPSRTLSPPLAELSEPGPEIHRPPRTHHLKPWNRIYTSAFLSEKLLLSYILWNNNTHFHTVTSNASRTSKLTKPPNHLTSLPAHPGASSSSSRSSYSSHLAMVGLKQRIINSLSKLSDRDTYQIAVEDLEKTIQTLSPEVIPMLLNCLYDALNDPKAAVKKESLRLFTMVCASHVDSTWTHLTKIIAHIVKRLKGSDSALKDACRDKNHCPRC